MTDRKLISGLALGAFISLFLACAIGTTSIAPDRLLAAAFGGGAAGDRIVFWEIRFPRGLAALVVGAALGASGAALQALLRNPLAEPGVLGVSASAALGATIVLFYGANLLPPTMLPSAVAVAAIAGALAATALLSVIAVATPSASTLILFGIGLSSFAGAAMALFLNFAPNPFSLAELISWTLGSVANKSLPDLGRAAPFLLGGGVLIAFAARGLSALSLGEEAAAAIGADVSRTRLMTVAGTGLLTGAAVSIAGAVGFVGIVAPHLIRPYVGYDPARTLIPSALLGGVLLVAADVLVRVLPTPSEMRLGVVAALVGAPVFIWIAAGRSRRLDNGGAP